MKLYLAGPMSGRPQHNAPAFDAAAEQLRALGYDVVSPPEITRANPVPGIGADGSIHPAAYAQLVRLDLLALLDCAAVVVLPGWSVSRGAKLEQAVANAIGVPVYRLESFVRREFGAHVLDAEILVRAEGLDYRIDRTSEHRARPFSVEQADAAAIGGDV